MNRFPEDHARTAPVRERGTPDPDASHAAASSPFTKKNILIVDDVPANARLLAKKLSDEYTCTTAATGEDALLRAQSDRPDLILLDVLMPGMDGFEVCRRLKGSEKTRMIPIIFITSLGEDDDEAKGLALGAVDYVRKPFRMPIVKARVRNHMELKQARDLLEKQAFIDSLTTIPNRRRFDEIMDKEWYRAMRDGTPLSLVLMDIDFFKKYNDNYGHQQGDDCLRRVGRALQDGLRRSTDFAARYGGEEFALILPNTDTKGALAVARSIRQQIAELAIIHEYSTTASRVTVSQGVATLLPDVSCRTQENRGPEELLQAADRALYKAKAMGRDRIET